MGGPTTTPAGEATTRPCPTCGAVVPSGRFCGECGASLDGASCPACRTRLEAGARFCHRCGTALGVRAQPLTGPVPPRQLPTLLPWAVAVLALVALGAFVAGRSIGGGGGAAVDDSQTAQAAQDAPATSADGSVGADGGGAIRAPDISNMSPRERADRLYDRVMRLNEEGKSDSVDFFAPMVMSAYQMLGALDLDQHYDLGRVGEVTGAAPLARAEADTILRADPTHLLGLALAARVATDAHQDAAARSYYRRLVAAEKTERAKNLPEYARHGHDIDAALAEAKQMGVTGA